MVFVGTFIIIQTLVKSGFFKIILLATDKQTPLNQVSKTSVTQSLGFAIKYDI